jgi:hypothetical protein
VHDATPSDPLEPVQRLMTQGIHAEAMGDLLASVLGPGSSTPGAELVQRIAAQQGVRRLRADFAEGRDVSAIVDGVLRRAAPAVFGHAGDPETRREWMELCADMAAELPRAIDRPGGAVSSALHSGVIDRDLAAREGSPLLMALVARACPPRKSVDVLRRNPLGATR